LSACEPRERSPQPIWATRQLPAFREVLRVVTLSLGFTLVPIEISGPDVAKALATWLRAEGHEAHVVAPLTDDDWKHLVARIFDITTHEQDVVLVVGARDLSPAAAQALRLVNQRRDTIARHLGRPLLWCGPHEFLDATWDIAPDFWSVRAMTQIVEGVMSLPPEPSFPPSHWVSYGVERLREIWAAATLRRDVQSMERVALNLATALMDELAYEEADAILDEARRVSPEILDTPVRRSLLLLRAQTHLLRGKVDEAKLLLECVPEAPLDHANAGERALVQGNVALNAGATAALAMYREAERAFACAGDRRNEGVSIWSAANACVGQELLEDAAFTFELALGIFRELADARNEARALSSLGRVHAALHDMRTANAYFDDALVVTREISDRHGEATVLRRLARIYVSIGDPEKAIEDCERALAIARTLKDRRGEGKSLTVLGAAESALGNRRRAEPLLDEAWTIAEELGDARMRTTLELARRSLPPPPSS
jgi:tetratricopeptide (TPR) repeat protein